MSLEDYIREYLDDPISIGTIGTSASITQPDVTDLETYIREYLDDPLP